jgi:hypothetical protein
MLNVEAAGGKWGKKEWRNEFMNFKLKRSTISTRSRGVGVSTNLNKFSDHLRVSEIDDDSHPLVNIILYTNRYK